MAAPEDCNGIRPRSPQPLLLAACLLAWVGVLICFLLLGRAAALFCHARLGCEKVLSSGYAALLGVPLPWVGAAFYAGVLGLLLSALGASVKARRLRALNAALWLSVAAASFSAALMWVQFGVLRAFCPLCTASALTVGAIALVLWRAVPLAEDADEVGSRAMAGALASFAAVTAVVMGVAIMAAPAARMVGPQRLEIDLATAKVAGPRDAAVRLVVFSDFQCQFCAQLAPVLKRVREEFPNDVLVAYRYFPLESHARAIPAAIAAECAAEQGAFWDYHDRIFAEGGDLSDARLLALATSMGLDKQKFRECLDSGRGKNVVEASYRDAIESGLEGAPALFLDGRRIDGALAYETLAPQITERIKAARARANQPRP
jgi:protein-disulfide isomerase